MKFILCAMKPSMQILHLSVHRTLDGAKQTGSCVAQNCGSAKPLIWRPASVDERLNLQIDPLFIAEDRAALDEGFMTICYRKEQN